MHKTIIKINRLEIRLKRTPLDTVHAAREGLGDALLQTLKERRFQVSGQESCPISRIDAGALSVPDRIGGTEIKRAIAAHIIQTLQNHLSDNHTRRGR